MLTKIISPGNKVDVMVRDKAEPDGKKNYESRVYDVLSDEEFEIHMPMEKSKLILLPVGGVFDFYFYTNNGLYQCNARIKDRYKSGATYILLCEPTTNLRKYQRREFYRFACILKMSSRKLEGDELEAAARNEQYYQVGLPLNNSVIVDISGGGVRFVSRTKYDAGTLIYLTYKLNINGKEKEYEITGKILDSYEVPGKSGQYEHRVKYLNMENEVREEIIRYIFEEERKSRQRKNG
ncbi:MAG: flagellar brake protein [Lachnospiraceae bacterium]|nr:flagellar brake protein [Lachnospiraceae bacterium]